MVPTIRRRPIALEGYYGEGNAGDDAFCYIASHHLASRRVHVLGRPNLAPVMPPNARFVLPSAGPIRRDLLQLKVGAGTVLHVGGSTFRRLNRRKRDEQWLARLRLVEQMACGVSVGPFRSTKDELDMRRFLRHFSSISTRDSASFERLRGIAGHTRIEPGFDLAVLLPEVLGVTRSQAAAQPVVGVAPRSFELVEGLDAGIERQRFANFAMAIRAIVASGARVRLFALNRHPRKGDVDLCRSLHQEVKSNGVSVIVYDGDLNRLLRAVAECSSMLAMRLHAAIFAYSLGVPLSIVAYHPKCSEFAEEVRLDPRYVFDAQGPSPDSIKSILDTLTEHPESRPIDDARRSAAHSLSQLNTLA